MPALVTRLLRRMLWGMLVSVLGGGLLLWLAGNGLNLQEDFAALLRLAENREYRPYTLTAGALVILGCFIFLAYLVARLDRPPRATTSAVRQAAVGVLEDALCAVPDQMRSELALRKLRVLLHDVSPYRSVARKVDTLLNLSQAYLFQLVAASFDEANDVAALHDRALAAVDDLMSVTRWAAEGDDLQD